MEIKNDNHILNIDKLLIMEKDLNQKLITSQILEKEFLLNQLTEKNGLHMKKQWHIINGTMKAK